MPRFLYGCCYGEVGGGTVTSVGGMVTWKVGAVTNVVGGGI